MLVPKYRDTSNRVHALGVQESGKLGQIRDHGTALLRGQRVIESYVENSVTILYVEYHRIAAQLTPAADNAQAVVAAGHDSG